DGEFRVASAGIENGKLAVHAATETDREGVRKWARRMGLSIAGESGDALTYDLSSTHRSEVRKRAMAQVLEVLRRRITDPIEGIPDSVVTGQGEGRILVQIPGGQIDRNDARRRLEVTGHLEFKIVQDAAQ